MDGGGSGLSRNRAHEPQSTSIQNFLSPRKRSWEQKPLTMGIVDMDFILSNVWKKSSNWLLALKTKDYGYMEVNTYTEPAREFGGPVPRPEVEK